MNRRVRLSELLGHAEVDEGRSLRTERRRSNSEMDGRRCGRREQRKLIRARRGGLDAELCREPVQRCADEARCRSAARAPRLTTPISAPEPARAKRWPEPVLNEATGNGF